jgi:hypothetical protein
MSAKWWVAIAIGAALLAAGGGAAFGGTETAPAEGDAGERSDEPWNVITLDGVDVIQLDSAWAWSHKLAIDADGAPSAYHPRNIGIDALANAGHPGNWWGIVTDTGENSGEPVVKSDGYYISKTSLSDGRYGQRDQRRYVDATLVPFLAIARGILGTLGAELGDLAWVVNLQNGLESGALVADIAGTGKLHEGSIALADRLGVPSSPRRGGASGGIAYLLFPGSSMGWPAPGFEDVARASFDEWGGQARLRRVLGA